MKKIYRTVFVALAIVNLVFGILAGLGRLGWSFPVTGAIVHHGAIMVGGFLGTLVSLEKVIPLKKKAYLLIPVISASGIIAFSNGQFETGTILLITASAGLAGIYLIYLGRQGEYYLYLMFTGAVCWCIGNVMLLSQRFYPIAFPWWMGFLLFTIVSERLELSKFLPVTRAAKIFLLGSLGLFLIGLIVPFHGPGTYFSGTALVLISLWLLRYDIVRVNIRKKGLTRFTGYALIFGYTAMLLDGIFLMTFPEVPYAYDAIVHTFFLGFVFSMIFAHGPIILPGVLGISGKPYHPFLYVPLFTMAFSVLMRITADAGILPEPFRMVSGWLSASAILLYFLTLITITIRSLRNARLL